MKAATVLLSLFVSTAALAQQTDPAPQPAPAAKEPKDTKDAPAKEPFVVAAGEVKLRDLIDRCAAYLGCNIFFSPLDLAPGAPPVNVAKAVSTDRDGCLELLANSLHGQKLALTWLDERAGMLEVISCLGPRSREILGRAPVVGEADVASKPSLCMAVIVFVELKHTQAVIVANKLRSMAGPNADLSNRLVMGSVGRVSGIVLAGFRPEIAEAIRTVREIDQPSPGSPLDRQKRIDGLEKRIRALEEQLAVVGEKGDEKAAEKGK